MLRTLLPGLTLAMFSGLGCGRDRDVTLPSDSGIVINFSNTQDSIASNEADDTVYVASTAGSRRLVWETAQGARIWESGDLYGASPQHTLIDLDGDGARDLFWSVVFEEMMGSGIVLRTSSGARKVEVGVVQCRVGTVGLETDGPVITLYTVGAHPGGDCDDPIIRTCAERVRMDWPRMYRVENYELVERPMPSEFYDGLAAEYRRAAIELDSLVRVEAKFARSSHGFELCGADTPTRIRQLADSAARLAQMEQR
jgi:hypothetical protein